jgi:hypothetical protein
MLVVCFLTGCASSGPKTADASGWIKDDDLQKVWVAPGFSFTGYDVVVVPEVQADAQSRSDEEKAVLVAAKRAVQNEFISRLQDSGVFKSVVREESQIPSGSKALILTSNIYSHEKGGGGARFFAGLYGAGQPDLKIRGAFKDKESGEEKFKFDSERHGDSAGARMGGVFRSDESIQTDDVQDLAKDLANYVARAAGKMPAKK